MKALLWLMDRLAWKHCAACGRPMWGGYGWNLTPQQYAGDPAWTGDHWVYVCSRNGGACLRTMNTLHDARAAACQGAAE